MEPEAWTAERDRLERLDAQATRARDQAGKAPSRPQAKPVAPRGGGLLARHPPLAGALWGGRLVLFFGALGLWISQEQKPRGDGETATGTVGRGERGSQAAGAPGARFPAGPSRADCDTRIILGCSAARSLFDPGATRMPPPVRQAA